MNLEKYDKPYSAWFGEGNLREDIEEIIAEHGEPETIYEGAVGVEDKWSQNKFMACLIYKDKIIVTGYDNSEYHQTYEFVIS